jgi:hypothetical protein
MGMASRLSPRLGASRHQSRNRVLGHNAAAPGPRLGAAFSCHRTSSASVLIGGISLVVIFVYLLVTSLISSKLVITGATTWILATLIVWVFGVAAMLLLPMVIFKKTLAAARSDKRPACRLE